MGLVKGWAMDWGTVTVMVTVKEKDCRAVPASATTANEIRHSSHYPGHNCVCLLEPAKPSHEAFVGSPAERGTCLGLGEGEGDGEGEGEGDGGGQSGRLVTSRSRMSAPFASTSLNSKYVA